MSILIPVLVAALAVIAVIHALWGFGIWVPISDEARLVRAVVGARDTTRMPGPIPCGLVAAGLIVIIGAIFAPDTFIRGFILWSAGIVLMLRGVLTWVPVWRVMTPVEPFATLDRWVYSPLCLALGIGIICVVAA